METTDPYDVVSTYIYYSQRRDLWRELSVTSVFQLTNKN